jgi:hypothetical protein
MSCAYVAFYLQSLCEQHLVELLLPQLYLQIKYIFKIIRHQPITINVPAVYTARYVLVLRRARSIRRSIGRGGPRKSRLFEPKKI